MKITPLRPLEICSFYGKYIQLIYYIHIFINPKPVTTATIPYIKGTSETIARILQPYNIRVAHKSHYDFATATNQRYFLFSK